MRFFHSYRRFTRGFAVIACVMVAASAVVASADTRGDLDAAKARLSDLRAELDAEQAALSDLQAELNRLAGQIEVAASQVEQTRQDIAVVEADLAAAERALEASQNRLNERAADAYMNGPATQFDFLLGSGSMGELSDRVEYLGVVQESDRDLSNEFMNLQNELGFARERLGKLLTTRQGALDQLEAASADMEQRFAEQQASLNRINDLRAEAEGLVSRLEKKLDAELAAIPEIPTGGGGSGDGIPGPLHACPVQGPHAYADTFGDIHSHPGWTHVHEGNDISAPYGTPIVAPFDGVATSSSDETAGTYVTVAGSEGSVMMLHMSSLAQLGSVSTGTVVGYVGTSGNASTPHTHFEWHPGGGAAADPYPQLNEVC